MTPIELIREDEQHTLSSLPPQPAESHKAYTDVPVSNDLYRFFEKPPTRHKSFVIRTFWNPNPWRPLYHFVYVVERGKVRIVVPTRDGAFGESQ